MVDVVVSTRLDGRFRLSRFELSGMVDGLVEAMGIEVGRFTLRLVDDAEISRLNLAFLGCIGPTNVLSFPVDANEESVDESWGEIALSVDTLARETDLYGQEPAEHLARLLAHAILHLTGMDHGPEMDMLTEAGVERFRTD
ncbi:MAG: rRNA maturation RNase YbeY [Proteobacteria bacterium]|nr:rRNA maturation RNase YbeY [Pseudomonadota bacterium]